MRLAVEAVVGGAASVHEVERVLKVHFPDGDFGSISGLVYEMLGRPPAERDVVELAGVRLEVLATDGAHIRDWSSTR
jgi:CBS domain containing-hemolysin-like protein